MSWIERSPFEPDEDTSGLLFALFTSEAEASGWTLSNHEREILGSGMARVPWDLEARVRHLLAQMIEKDDAAKPSNPRGIGTCIQWSELGTSNLARFAHAVASEQASRRPVQWKLWFKDKVALVGCGVVAVIGLALFSTVITFLFGHK